MHRKPIIYTGSALALLFLDIAAVVLLERWLAVHSFLTIFLALPLAFLYLHASMVALLLSMLAVRKIRQGLLDKAIARLEPELHRLFSECAYGSGEFSEIAAAFHGQPRAVEQVLVGFMPSVTGKARETLGQAAVHLGLLDKWRHMARSRKFLRRKAAIVALSTMPLSLSRDSLSHLLKDPEEEIGILAARALLQTGEPEVVEQIFHMILERSLLVRACVAEDLRKYAAVLSQTAVPKALAGADDKRTGIVLDILGAWQRSLWLDGWETIYEKADAANRIAILNLLPYIITPQQPAEKVIQALNDEDNSVRIAAAALVGRWQLDAALPALAGLLGQTRVEVAKAAAQALTNLGEPGKAVLENTILEAGGEAGRIAAEALQATATAR